MANEEQNNLFKGSSAIFTMYVVKSLQFQSIFFKHNLPDDLKLARHQV